MPFMIPGTHVDVASLTAEDIQIEQGIQGGLREAYQQGPEHTPVIQQGGESSMRQQCFQQETEGRDSVEKEAESDADDKESDHAENETTRTTAAPPGPPGDSSSKESNIKSYQARSPPTTTKPRKATRRNFDREKSADKCEWESLTPVIAIRRTTKKSKALKGFKLDPPEILYRDNNKWKNSYRCNRCVNALQRF